MLKGKEALQGGLKIFPASIETVADSIVVDSSRNFDSDREMEEKLKAMTKTEDEDFKEMLDRCVARWEIGKNMNVAELGSQALQEIANSELEDDATFIHNDFIDDGSFFESDDEDKFYCMDEDVFLPTIRGRHSNSDSFVSTPRNELTVGKT